MRQGETFPIWQWENASRFSEASTLPSFLYLLSQDEAEHMSASDGPRPEWVPGRFARARSAESPGRVVHSAKSWLCHHAVDRHASFLPWRSDEIPVEKRISPIRASALLLEYLRAAWNSRFAPQGMRFEDQEITITVPASFDAAAQKLTLDAASEAGFPAGIRLLEEPQAAFYWWLQQRNRKEFPYRNSFPRLPFNMYWSLILEAALPTSRFLRFLPGRRAHFRASNAWPSVIISS